MYTVEVRPYQLKMTTTKWKEIEPTVVSLHNLVFTQWHLWTLALLNPTIPFTQDDLPYFVFHQGRYYVEDGHHRVVRAILRGHTLIKGRVYVSTNGSDFLTTNTEETRTLGNH